MTEDEYWDIFDGITDYQAELDNNVPVAGKNTTVLFYNGDDIPDEFTRVATQPYGIDGIGEAEDAYLVT